jgi:tRNA A-37 threonylcarbamoyl transferase component Bud32
MSLQVDSSDEHRGTDSRVGWCEWCGTIFPDQTSLNHHRQQTTRGRDKDIRSRSPYDSKYATYSGRSYHSARVCLPKVAPQQSIDPTASVATSHSVGDCATRDETWRVHNEQLTPNRSESERGDVASSELLEQEGQTATRGLDRKGADSTRFHDTQSRPGLLVESQSSDTVRPPPESARRPFFVSWDIAVSRTFTQRNAIEQLDMVDSPLSSLTALRRAQLSTASPRSFGTAQSSLASFRTAPSAPRSIKHLHDSGISSEDVSPVLELSSDVPGQVFSSEWLSHLHHRGILPDPKNELDWSGRGQHVEYDLEHADQIPLAPEKILGHGASAIVESVKCRRIRLARKTIKCDRRLRKEDAITEVEHLLRLQHLHIVRVVGTYTLGKSLAILLYPVTQWTLDEFMDETTEEGSGTLSTSNFHDWRSGGAWYGHILIQFLGCLSNAISFVHEHNIKHMDIKPKNLLVRSRGYTYKVYIADFGIARAYASPEETITDSPISFTRTYAAPEVVAQQARGSSADVFSLGCVFMEMLATVVSSTADDQRRALLASRKSNSVDSSYSANVESVLQWYRLQRDRGRMNNQWLPVSDRTLDSIASMIAFTPGNRPSMSEINKDTMEWCCSACNSGPEQFEAADTRS